MELGRLGYTSDGPLRDFLRATRRIRDYRIGPMMSSGWQLLAGNAPSELEINIMGPAPESRAERAPSDVLDLLDAFSTSSGQQPPYLDAVRQDRRDPSDRP
jgi:hypothetical protein